jgi:hypothetical protein
VPAGHCERDPFLFVSLDVYPGKDPPSAEFGDIRKPRIREGAVVFAQMTPEAPFFVDINTFHFL